MEGWPLGTDFTPSVRATYFQIVICAVLLAEAIAPFIASAMMGHSVWLPILISPAVMAMGGLAITMVPETLEMRFIREQSRGAASRPPITPTFSRRVRRYHAHTFDASTPWTRLRARIGATSRLLQVRDVKLLLPTASLAIPLATVTMSIVLRSLPLRLGWTLAQAGKALGARAALNALVLLAVLPPLRRALSGTTHGARDPDLWLARASAVLLAAGQVVLAAAPGAVAALVGLAVFTLGTGAPSLCRAALVRRVDGDAAGRLFGLLALCEMVGYLVGGVGLGALYQVGMRLGLGPDGSPRPGGEVWWLALVFCVAAAVYFCCAGMLWAVDEKEAGNESDVESVHTGCSGRRSREAYEARVLADGRVTRKCPSLETVSVAFRRT